MSKLTGKVAIVTGASKGIGAAIAKSLAAEAPPSLLITPPARPVLTPSLVASLLPAVRPSPSVATYPRPRRLRASSMPPSRTSAASIFSSTIPAFTSFHLSSPSPKSSSTRYSISTCSVSYSPPRPLFPTSARAQASSISALSSAA